MLTYADVCSRLWRENMHKTRANITMLQYSNVQVNILLSRWAARTEGGHEQAARTEGPRAGHLEEKVPTS